MLDMFTDTITIFNVVDSKYYRSVVHNVYFHVDKIISPEGHGEKYTSVHRVIFSKEALEKYLSKQEYICLEDKSKNFTLNENDIIVLGEFKEIENAQEIYTSNNEYFTIKTISDNQKSILKIIDNIEVTD